MSPGQKKARVILFLVLVAGIALTVLFPPTVYLESRPLTAAEKARIEAEMAQMAALPGPAAGPTQAPETVSQWRLTRMPIWQDAPEKQVNWRGWTDPERQQLEGTSATSFLNGGLFQIMLIAAVCLIPLALIDRAAKRAATPDAPATDSPADGGAPVE